ncbi:MAG: DmsE family decaheme c-type cytochrome [Leptothrix sp. (in: b-proteobacteria)]
MATGLAGAAWAQTSAQQAAPALPTIASTAADRTLEGDKTCTSCHDESENKPVLAIYKTAHGVKADKRTPGCQSCHGASVAHVKNTAGTSTRPAPDVVFSNKTANSSDQIKQACLTCHKGGQRTHWSGSQHENAGVACTNCHAVHTHQDKVLTKAQQQEVCFACHKSERAQTHRLSTHPLAAGKMSCSDCHNPHGSVGPKLMSKDSVNETCASCHAEKRGPFLWEHEPATESCANCHTPHGSNNAPLLKARAPWLCQNCHSGDHAAQVNSGANLQDGGVTTANGKQPLAGAAARAQMGGRACLSCHMVVHGSNHPAGAKFQR